MAPRAALVSENYPSKHDTCDRVLFGMAERNKGRRDAAFCASFRRPGKNEEWFAALFFADVDVAPTHRFADAGAERFCNGLFARETRGQMRAGNFIDIEYSISPSVKTRWRKRSPNRSIER